VLLGSPFEREDKNERNTLQIENSLTAVISFEAWELLHDKYGFDIGACEDMPDCGLGQGVHIIPSLEDLMEFLENDELSEIQIENLTEKEKKTKAINITEQREGKVLFEAYEARARMGLDW
jgi:hypothetical protein